MKTTKITLTLLSFLFVIGSLMAQQTKISNLRPYDQDGVNKFEYLKQDQDLKFEGVKVRIGGNFAQQFQALDHSNTSVDLDGDEVIDNPLYDLEPGFNLATANLNIDVQLADGVRLNMIAYLSSRHHPETWVKGGYIQFDKFPFLKSETIDNLMQNFMVRVGHMEVNFGDTHFRRTDNGNGIYNPFVGNYIVDVFNTEIGAEVYYTKNGLIGMLGVTGGEINGNIAKAPTSDVDDKAKRSPAYIGKLGYDSQINEKLRLRLTGSAYYTASSAANHIFDGDRGGSRYYLVMEAPTAKADANFRSGHYNPGFGDKVTAFMGNAFVKAGGLEFFGTYEVASGRKNNEVDTRNMTQIAGDLLYRFGQNEDWYLGGRYNTVTADDLSGQEVTINRYQIGAGWFVIDNILVKLEYVNQQYKDFPTGSIFQDGEFKGAMIEAVVGF